MSKFSMLDLCLGLMKLTGEKFSTEITLFIKGIVITGTLIHSVAYFKGLGEFLEAQPNEGANQVAEAMLKSIEATTKASTKTKEEDNNKYADVIYLKDIALWNPPIRMPIERSFLELRIDAIDGFIWGEPLFPVVNSEA